MLPEILARVRAEGRAAHPDIDLDDGRLSACLARLALDAAPAACADLYLACACAEGVPAALASFERAFIAPIDLALPRGADPRQIDELRQRVRVLLLVGRDDQPPRVGAYRGKGALSVWVRVIALREHQRMRADRHQEADDELPDLAALSPELAATRAQHREAALLALRAALQALPDRQRLLLKLAYVDGLSTEAAGRIFGVNKGTISRWLAAARDSLLTDVVARVAGATGASSSEIRSLLRLMASDLELSLAASLRGP